MTQGSPTSTMDCPLFGRWERAFVAGDRPVPTLEFSAEFTSPSGVVITRPGYWDGGETWRLRFMPAEPGEWRYHTFSTPKSSLHKLSGRFQCGPASGTDRFAQHGLVRVASGGSHFAHADGTPFFFLSDTTWNGPLLSSEPDWAAYLADRAAKGFTAVQFIPLAPWIGAYTNAEAEVGYTAHPLFPINPHFFRRIDERIDAINARGLLAAPVLLWSAPAGGGGGHFNPGASLDEQQMLQLVRYQVARYGAHHVLWVLAGDGRYEGELGERVRRIGRAIFDDPARAPVALHPYGKTWPYVGFRREKWLDVIGYQSSHSADPDTLRWLQSGPAAEEWKLTPARPIINLEPCYEGLFSGFSKAPISDTQVRQAAYWSLLNAPTAGVSYGAHGVWSWEESPRAPLNHAFSGIAKPWREAKDLPGSFDMQRLAAFFGSLPWWRLRPDPSLLAVQPGARDSSRFIAAARTSDDGADAARVFYLPMGGELTMSKSALVGSMSGEWFDPRTGKRIRIPSMSNGKCAAPDSGDWLFVARASCP